jgi:ATP-dependent exoDNAse (exonuclease V) beta subunit
MTLPFIPADQDIRYRIRDCLDENLLVEAGAGTGKTTGLVERVVRLITTGCATLDQVAAITFTEAAAAELRDRVRENLERSAEDPALPKRNASVAARELETWIRRPSRSSTASPAVCCGSAPWKLGCPPTSRL